MPKLCDLCTRRKKAPSKLLSMHFKAYKAFLDMEAATFGDGALCA